MEKELRIYLCAIGLPALMLAAGSLFLLGSAKHKLRENERIALGEKASELSREISESLFSLIEDDLAKYYHDAPFSFPGQKRSEKAHVVRGARLHPSPMGTPKDAFRYGEKTYVLEIDDIALLMRTYPLLKRFGADNPDDKSALATVAEIRSTGGELIFPSSSGFCDNIHGEAALHPPLDKWKIRLSRREGEKTTALDERIFWTIGSSIVLLLVSTLFAGGYLLWRNAKKTREEALGKIDFVSAVSHEFKTPLTSILLCAELLKDESPDGEMLLKAAGTIEKEACRLKKLTQDVLDFGKIERGMRKPNIEIFSLSSLAEEVCSLFRPDFAENGLAAKIRENISVKSDREAIRQILSNLLENAGKYAAAYGTVDVELSAENGFALLCVRDRGCEFSGENPDVLFEKFYRHDMRTVREKPGTGLGLAISKGLANSLGATLSARKRTGGGLEFIFKTREWRNG